VDVDGVDEVRDEHSSFSVCGFVPDRRDVDRRQELGDVVGTGARSGDI